MSGDLSANPDDGVSTPMLGELGNGVARQHDKNGRDILHCAKCNTYMIHWIGKLTIAHVDAFLARHQHTDGAPKT